MVKINKKSASLLSVSIGVFALVIAPIGASAATDTTTVSVTVDSSIAVSSTATTNLGSVIPGGSAVTATNTVSVDNNDIDGYTLSIQSSDSTSTLDGAVDGGTIAPSTGTPDVPVTLADDTWGYRLAGFSANTYAGMTSSPVEIVNKNGTFVDDQTVITYATKVTGNIPADTYSDEVTYTALVK